MASDPQPQASALELCSKLTLEYDGGRFCGWARQAGQRSVQQELESALKRILGDRAADGSPLRLTVAGRTDAGVHAWGQVASYAHEALDPRRLNALLPEDVAVLSCEPVHGSFDARRDARSRTYCYRIFNRSTRSPFNRESALWWPRELDREALDRCAAELTGTHDFTAFTPTETEHVRFERDVLSASWNFENDLLEFWIQADTFMRHMNRVLIGTMLQVASGSRTPEDFKRLLAGAHRSEAGFTAPPHGLALAKVSYD